LTSTIQEHGANAYQHARALIEESLGPAGPGQPEELLSVSGKGQDAHSVVSVATERESFGAGSHVSRYAVLALKLSTALQL